MKTAKEHVGGMVLKRYKIQEDILKNKSFLEYVTSVSTIISTKDTGIANRLKSLASAIRLSKIYKKNFGVYWNSSINIQNQDGSPHRPPSKFSDSFENDFEIDDLDLYEPHDALLMRTWRLCVMASDGIQPGFCKHIDNYAPTGIAIDFEYDRIPDHLKEIYSEIFSMFNLKRHIQKKINGFQKRHFDEKTISVHMRSYNDAAGTRGKRKGVYSFDVDNFIDEMKKQDDDCSFFVCSDSAEAVECIRSIFGNRVITYSMSHIRSNEDDIIELYLLSKNKIIIGTKSSTFTEVAWWLSSCKMESVIV